MKLSDLPIIFVYLSRKGFLMHKQWLMCQVFVHKVFFLNLLVLQGSNRALIQAPGGPRSGGTLFSRSGESRKKQQGAAVPPSGGYLGAILGQSWPILGQSWEFHSVLAVATRCPNIKVLMVSGPLLKLYTCVLHLHSCNGVLVLGLACYMQAFLLQKVGGDSCTQSTYFQKLLTSQKTMGNSGNYV